MCRVLTLPKVYLGSRGQNEITLFLRSVIRRKGWVGTFANCEMSLLSIRAPWPLQVITEQ